MTSVLKRALSKNNKMAANVTSNVSSSSSNVTNTNNGSTTNSSSSNNVINNSSSSNNVINNSSSNNVINNTNNSNSNNSSSSNNVITNSGSSVVINNDFLNTSDGNCVSSVNPEENTTETNDDDEYVSIEHKTHDKEADDDTNYVPYARGGSANYTTSHRHSGRMSFARANSTTMDSLQEISVEKTNLQKLNTRLATYIEKVRYLEAYNKTLDVEIEKLKSERTANGDMLRNLYETQLSKNRSLLEMLQCKINHADVAILALQDKLKAAEREATASTTLIDNLKTKNTELVHGLGVKQNEVTRLEQRSAMFESEASVNRDLVRNLQTENLTLKTDLDSETMLHLSADQKATDLEMQLNFISCTYKQEIVDLKLLLSEGRGDAEVKEYWKGELAKAIRDIQAEYDARLDSITHDMQAQFMQQMQAMKAMSSRGDSSASAMIQEAMSRQQEKCSAMTSQVTDLMTENARLSATSASYEARITSMSSANAEQLSMMKSQLSQYKSDHESMAYEIQMLMNAKLSMQLEIATYKKLLEHEEIRIEDWIEENASETHGRHHTETEESEIADIAIADVADDGSYIAITNQDTEKTYSLHGWTLVKGTDESGEQKIYEFGDFKMEPNQTIKIAGAGSVKEMSGTFLTADFETWGSDSADISLLTDTKQTVSSATFHVTTKPVAP